MASNAAAPTDFSSQMVSAASLIAAGAGSQKSIADIERELNKINKQIAKSKKGTDLNKLKSQSETLQSELASAKLREEELTKTPRYPESFSTEYRAINLGSIVHSLRAVHPGRPSEKIDGTEIELNWMNWVLNRPNDIVTILVPRLVPPVPEGAEQIATPGTSLSDVPVVTTFLLRAVTRNPVSDSSGTKLLLFNDGVNFGDVDPIREYLQSRSPDAKRKIIGAGDFRIVVSQASLNDSSAMESQKRNANSEDYLSVWVKDVVRISDFEFPNDMQTLLDESNRIRTKIATQVPTVQPIDDLDTPPIEAYTTTVDDITLIPGIAQLGHLDSNLKDIVAIHFVRRIPITPVTMSGVDVSSYRSAVSASNSVDNAKLFQVDNLTITGQDYYIQHGVYLKKDDKEIVICSPHRSNVGPSADVLYEAMLPYLNKNEPKDPGIANSDRMFQPQQLAYQVYQTGNSTLGLSKENAKRLVYHVLSLKKAGADLLNGAIASQCTTFFAEQPAEGSNAAETPTKVLTQIMTPDGGSFLGYVKTWRVPCVLRKSDGYPVTNRIGSVPPATLKIISPGSTAFLGTQQSQEILHSLATETASSQGSPPREKAVAVPTSTRRRVETTPSSSGRHTSEDEDEEITTDDSPLYHLYRFKTGKRIRYIVDNIPVATKDSSSLEPGYAEVKTDASGKIQYLPFEASPDTLEELHSSNSLDEILNFIGLQVGLDLPKLQAAMKDEAESKEEEAERTESEKFLTNLKEKLGKREGTGKDETIRMRLKMLQESDETTISPGHRDIIYTMIRESPRSYTSYGHARYPLRDSTMRTDGYNALIVALDAWKDIYLRKEAKYNQVVDSAKQALTSVVKSMNGTDDLLASMLKNPQAYEAVIQTAGYDIRKEGGLEVIAEEGDESDEGSLPSVPTAFKKRGLEEQTPGGKPGKRLTTGGTYRNHRKSGRSHTYKRRHI
jgi:hypothetical protein